jgi:hypothetical protein
LKRKKKSNRVALSFAATIIGISVAVGLVIALPPPAPGNVAIRHIPQSLPAYTGVLGEYAPADAVQVSFNNLTAIRAINASVVSTSEYLAFQDPALSISVSDVRSRLSIVLSKPNVTVNVAFLSQTAFATVSSGFNSSNVPRSRQGNYTFFSAAEVTSSAVPVGTWVTMKQTDRAFISCTGALDAFDALGRILLVRNGSSSSILDRQDVHRMFFTVNGTAGHLALGIQNYPGAVTSGTMTLISVDNLGRSLALDYTVGFSSSSVAQSQLGYAMKVYLGAFRFTSYDEFVQATEYQPTSALKSAIAQAG